MDFFNTKNKCWLLLIEAKHRFETGKNVYLNSLKTANL